MSSQPPEDPDPQPQNEAEASSSERRDAADTANTSTPMLDAPVAPKPPWWKFWAKR